MKILVPIGFGFILSLLTTLWMGIVPPKASLILATIGAGIIVINYFRVLGKEYEKTNYHSNT